MKKYKWDNMYTIVLVANVIYIIAFYFITKAF
ncbi:hypothetical protein DFR65_10269 [Oceanihabitans sediminis]|nr:hypothetical protein DFR65_10269 [Oceanihabitans sediminis]